MGPNFRTSIDQLFNPFQHEIFITNSQVSHPQTTKLLRFHNQFPWYSIISDPEFCNKLHQKRAYVIIYRKPETFSTITVESLKNGKPSIWSTPLFFPWQPDPKPESDSKILGSCNGLVCVSRSGPHQDGGSSGLILWNPSTRKFRELPPSSSPHRHWNDHGISYGFGYDESKDDYKFVWMARNDLHIPETRIEFDVFSLKSKTWNSFHRCGLSNLDIHALDLAYEEYRLLEFPQECELGSRVVSLSGCLCLCTPYNTARGSSGIDLWIMKEYGVDSTWLKFVSVNRTLSTYGGTMRLFTFYPILFSNEEGNNIVAVVEYFSTDCKKVCEIVRLQVENGAVVSSESLEIVSMDNVSAMELMEESLLSLN